MKLVLNEKLKHRLVGLGVVLSLSAIFLPTIMKKSNQSLDDSLHVRVKLPPKPTSPQVAVADEEQLFKTIKLSQIKKAAHDPSNQDDPDFILNELPSSKEPATMSLAIAPSAVSQAGEQIALAENKHPTVAAHSNKHNVNKNLKQLKLARSAPSKTLKKNNSHKAIAKNVIIPVKNAPKHDLYSVQLASFSQLSNAQVLVRKLQQKGYQATYLKAPGSKNTIYKVFVGRSPDKNKALKIKTQLASSMQLHGMIITNGVS